MAVAAGAALLAACSSTEKKAAAPVAKAAAPPEIPRITQLYTSPARLGRGEKGLLCYGVENAKTVWLEPPRHELSAALSRCVEITPAVDTTYKVTAEGMDGKAVTQELKVKLGIARARIVNLAVSALEVRAGELVSLCYTVENARAVTVDPIGFRGGSAGKGCAKDQPAKSTTYTISAVGAAGDQDEEHVTVQVK
jgi:hypothetical protein